MLFEIPGSFSGLLNVFCNNVPATPMGAFEWQQVIISACLLPITGPNWSLQRTAGKQTNALLLWPMLSYTCTTTLWGFKPSCAQDPTTVYCSVYSSKYNCGSSTRIEEAVKSALGYVSGTKKGGVWLWYNTVINIQYRSLLKWSFLFSRKGPLTTRQTGDHKEKVRFVWTFTATL